MGYNTRKSVARDQDKPHRLVPVTEVLESQRRTIPSRREYGAFRLKLAMRVFTDSLTPLQVAQLLEAAADAHPEIDIDECRLYRHWGQFWGGIVPSTSSATHLQREEAR